MFQILLRIETYIKHINIHFKAKIAIVKLEIT